MVSRGDDSLSEGRVLAWEIGRTVARQVERQLYHEAVADSIKCRAGRVGLRILRIQKWAAAL
jgi:hypothetical protein